MTNFILPNGTILAKLYMVCAGTDTLQGCCQRQDSHRQTQIPACSTGEIMVAISAPSHDLLVTYTNPALLQGLETTLNRSMAE